MINSTSITQVIPSDLLHELIQWRDQLSTGYWRVGDITNEIFALSVANQQELTKMQVYGKVAQVVGKSARSIRLYAAVSAFYPPDIREVYDLPFSHFVYAMQFRGDHETGMPVWQYVLQTSLALTTEYGISPSVDRLDENFRKEIEQQRQLEVSGVTMTAPATSNMGEVPDYSAGATPEFRLRAVYQELRMVTSRAIQALNVLDEINRTVGMGEVVRFQIAQAISANRDLLTEIEGMVQDARTLYSYSKAPIQD